MFTLSMASRSMRLHRRKMESSPSGATDAASVCGYRRNSWSDAMAAAALFASLQESRSIRPTLTSAGWSSTPELVPATRIRACLQTMHRSAIHASQRLTFPCQVPTTGGNYSYRRERPLGGPLIPRSDASNYARLAISTKSRLFESLATTFTAFGPEVGSRKGSFWLAMRHIRCRRFSAKECAQAYATHMPWLGG